MTESIAIPCRRLVKGRAEGEALVAPAMLSFWGEVDPMTGCVIAEGHPLQGLSLRGKVLVIQSTKGSSATPMVMGLAHQQGNAPVAMINVQVDPLAVLGCVVNGIPMVSDLDQDPLETIQTGDFVTVDADQQLVTVSKR